MTSLNDRPNTALLVVDIQNGVVDGAYNRDGVIANIAALVDKARAEEVPVVWVQHSGDELPKGSPQWEYVPELAFGDSEPVVHKLYGDPFEATDLEQVLAGLGIGHLVVAGAHTDACVRSTLHSAFTRGYDVTLVTDAHTTEDLTAYGAPSPDAVIAHTNLSWGFQSAPDRRAATVETSEVAFAVPE